MVFALQEPSMEGMTELNGAVWHGETIKNGFVA